MLKLNAALFLGNEKNNVCRFVTDNPHKAETLIN